MGAIGGVFGMLGSVVGAMGAQAQGRATQEAENINAINSFLLAKYKSDQMVFQGQSALAASQRTMEQTNLKTDYVQSQIQSRAAASGAGATDPTVATVQGQVAQQGTLAALTELWEGENKQTDYYNQARNAIYQGQLDAQAAYHRGDMAVAAADNQAMGSIIGGIGGLFGGFGKGFGFG